MLKQLTFIMQHMKYPCIKVDLLNISDPSIFFSIQPMDIHAIYAEAFNIRFTAHEETVFSFSQ